MRKMIRTTEAGNFLAQDLQLLVNGDSTKDRKSGVVASSRVGNNVLQAALDHCVANALEFEGGEFLKWVACDFERDDGGADRGVKKAHASPEWYGRTVEIVRNGLTSYCRLLGLYRLSSGVTVAVGNELQQCSHLPYNYGMPVLRCVLSRPLVTFTLHVDEISVCQLFPALRRLDKDYTREFSRDGWPAYSSEDMIFHHNIYCTYGELRYWDEKRWLTGK